MITLFFCVTSGCSLGSPSEPDRDAAAQVTPTESREQHIAWQKLQLDTGWGASWESLDYATTAVSTMPLADLAGQVIVAAYDGTSAPIELVNSLHLGGVIVFTRNVTSARDIASANKKLQQSVSRDWPVTVAIDQEGGIVKRVREPLMNRPAQMALGAARSPNLTTEVSAAAGRELVDIGFTTNYAPVADVTNLEVDVTIRTRAFSDDPEVVAEHAIAASRGLWDSRLVPVIKHFPGHGSVNADSHKKLPVLSTDLATLQRRDFVPFRRAADDEVPAVMVGHIVLADVDDSLPASLSPEAISVLRNDIGFRGLIVTDALDMGAVTKTPTKHDPAVMALLAGADVALMPKNPSVARQAIINAVRKGVLTRTRLEQAAARQIALLVEQRDAQASESHPSSSEVLQRLANESLVKLSTQCTSTKAPKKVALRGTKSSQKIFARVAPDLVSATSEITLEFIDATGPKIPRRRAQLSSDIVVSLGDPSVLASSQAPTRFAGWANDEPTMTALANVLRGRTSASGTMPVDGFTSAQC